MTSLSFEVCKSIEVPVSQEPLQRAVEKKWGTNNYLRGTASIGKGTKIINLRRTTSGSTGNGLGTTIKYLRRTTSGASGNGLGTTIKYLRRTTSGANRS
jgi:hypothetical protein